MKPVYAVRCRFHGDGEANAAKAWHLTTSWLGAGTRFEAPEWVADPDVGRVDLDDGSGVAWRIVRAGDAQVARITHDLPPGEDELGWRTIAWVCREGPISWGMVRSGPQNPEGVITTLRFDAKRPRVVSSWLDELHVVADGRRLGEKALNYGQNDAGALLDLLISGTRSLPVLGISKSIVDGLQRPALAPGDIAYRLAANAHVIVLDRACSWALTEAIGKPLSVYEGAVRLWWPRLSLSDDPYRHPLVVRDRLDIDAGRGENLFARRVWQAAVDALGPPSLETQVVSASTRAETERRFDELRSTATEATEWQELLEVQLDENEQLREQVGELQGDVDDLRLELVAARAQVDHDDDAEGGLPEAATVEEAVLQASTELAHVVFLPSAFAAARESRYPDPQQVLRDLRALGRVAQRWAAGDLGSGFKGAFGEEPVTYRDGIGQIASTKYRSDYEIDYGAATVMMGPHLRRGVGSPEAILRIYWYTDEATKQLVVGHVGRKLRDKGNS